MSKEEIGFIASMCVLCAGMITVFGFMIYEKILLIKGYKSSVERHLFGLNLEIMKREKELQALEIIKVKNVDISTLKRHKDVRAYNDFSWFWDGDRLTQQEFELLKEVVESD